MLQILKKARHVDFTKIFTTYCFWTNSALVAMNRVCDSKSTITLFMPGLSK